MLTPRGSERAYHIDEDTMVVMGDLSKIVAKCAKVVAQTHFEILAHLAVDRSHEPNIGGIISWRPQHARFRQNVPCFNHMIISTNNAEISSIRRPSSTWHRAV